MLVYIVYVVGSINTYGVGKGSGLRMVHRSEWCILQRYLYCHQGIEISIYIMLINMSLLFSLAGGYC